MEGGGSAADAPIERKADRMRGTSSDRSRDNHRRYDRGADTDRHRDRDRERDRDRSRDRGSRDGDRERERERSNRGGDRDRDRNWDRARNGDRDRDRDRHGSNSRDRGRDMDRGRRHRSRSDSSSSSGRSESPISRQQRLRREAQRRAAAKQDSDKYWDGFQWVKRQAGHIGNASGGASQTATELAQTLGIDQGNSKDRRIYVGNLPPGVSGDQLKDLINEALTAYIATNPATAAIADKHPPPVVSIWMSGEGKYGFIELFSASLAAVAMTLNGTLQYQGASLRVARPKQYNEQYGQQQPGMMGMGMGMALGGQYPGYGGGGGGGH